MRAGRKRGGAAAGAKRITRRRCRWLVDRVEAEGVGGWGRRVLGEMLGVRLAQLASSAPLAMGRPWAMWGKESTGRSF